MKVCVGLEVERGETMVVIVQAFYEADVRSINMYVNGNATRPWRSVISRWDSSNGWPRDCVMTKTHSSWSECQKQEFKVWRTCTSFTSHVRLQYTFLHVENSDIENFPLALSPSNYCIETFKTSSANSNTYTLIKFLWTLMSISDISPNFRIKIRNQFQTRFLHQYIESNLSGCMDQPIWPVPI